MLYRFSPYSTEKHPKNFPNFNLTDATVRSLKEGIHFDAKLPSFSMRVAENRRTWIVVKGQEEPYPKSGSATTLHYRLQKLVAAHIALLALPWITLRRPLFPMR